MKKKNGFTLIELLATIVIVISVLGIAIVSVMKLSEKQKENAYQKVKEQVMTAAQQYFSSNEYLFEGIDGTSYGIITVGKLVEEDYINKISNPITGKALNECDQIKVTKDETGKFILSYFESTENIGMLCSSNNSLMIKSHENAPEIILEFNATDENSDLWFNKSELSGKTLGDSVNGLFVKITTNTPDIKYCENDAGTNICSSDMKELSTNNGWQSNGKSGYYDTQNFNIEDKVKTICYVATNESGSTTNCISAGVDISLPNLDINISHNENAWHKTNLSYTVNVSDTISDIKSLNGYWNKSGLTTSEASSNEHKWNGNKDHYKTGDSNSADLSKIVNGVYSDGDNTTFSSQGHRKLAYIACDNAGNCRTSNEKQFKIDKTAPVVTVKTDADKDNNAWYNYTVTYTGTANDPYSGLASINSYWNKSGLTTTNADSTTYSWDGNKYPYGGSEAISLTSGSNSKTHSNTLSAEGHRKIRYVACDAAGNCSSDVKVVKIDKTPATMTTPKPCCIKKDGKCNPGSVDNINYVGNNLSYSDNLSGVKTRMGYNHCYTKNENASSAIHCGRYRDNGYLDDYIYKYNYENKLYSNEVYAPRSLETKQFYNSSGLIDSYYLFYKLTDNAGNVSYYRFKMKHNASASNAFSTVEFVSTSNSVKPTAVEHRTGQFNECK